MKFHIAINLERMTPDTSMVAVKDHVEWMIKAADDAGFEIAWAAEHHALEMTIAPNPFQIMMWWAGITQKMRLGCGVANAAYWHPINIAGEAALVDLVSGGRMDFGLGSGAYQREFDRMRPGLDQKDGYKYVQEMLPLVRKLWEGDVEHNGEHWQFPSSTSCPKPVQQDVPIWVAARSPITFDYAIEQNANIMSWPLTMPMAEAEKYKAQRDDSIARLNPGYQGQWAMMRHTSVYENDADRSSSMHALRNVLGQFGNLMQKKGDVINGFPERVPLEALDGNMRYDPDTLEENLMFGSPSAVVDKLGHYKELGVDAFIYYASMGLEMDVQKRSFETFVTKVMPQVQ